MHDRDSTPWRSLLIRLGCQSDKGRTDPGRFSPLLWTRGCLQWSGDHQADNSPWKEALPHCCHEQPLRGVEVSSSCCSSGSSRMIFPVSQNAANLHCSCLSHLRSPRGGTGLGSCIVAAHRGEYFEAAHSLFSLRECNGSYYLFCLSNCFFPFF